MKVLTYLEEEWGNNVADNFLKRIDDRIEMLKQYPELGIKSERINGVKGLLITKHNILFYKKDNDKIIILNLYDTRSKTKK